MMHFSLQDFEKVSRDSSKASVAFCIKDLRERELLSYNKFASKRLLYFLFLSPIAKETFNQEA